jgi:hypothetical protein
MNSQKAAFGKRSWVKLWTNEWLDGTTRYQMSDAQRAFWVDLLAMAGRSRFPGIICAGRDGECFVGYPLNRFQSLMAEPIDIEATLSLFERTGKVKLTVTSEGPPKLFVVELLNWRKYQSDLDAQAERARRYRSRKSRRHASVAQNVTPTSRNVTAVEEEGDGDREKDQIKNTAADAAAASRDASAAAAPLPDTRIIAAFESLTVKPFGSKAFQEKWSDRQQQIPNGEPSSFVEAMEDSIQICNANGIKVPRKFFDLKRAIEKLEVERCFHRTPI